MYIPGWLVTLVLIVLACIGAKLLGAGALVIGLVAVIGLLVGVVGFLMSCMPRWPG